MRHPASIQQVVDAGLCVSCGACAAVAPPGTVSMDCDAARARWIPVVKDPARVDGRGTEFAVCPGRGMPLRHMAADLFPTARYVTDDLGRFRMAAAARSTDPTVLEAASSGGVMTEIARHLIETGAVSAATAAVFSFAPGRGPRTEPILARTFEDLIRAQGSKYCPTVTCALINDPSLGPDDRVLFSGTPCQVAALRLAAQLDDRIARRFPITMANFCGGYRDFRDLDHLIRAVGLEPGSVTRFRFRGGGQPGSLLAATSNGETATVPYPEYGRLSVYPKEKRCTYCIDATGELADLACGDAWIPRFQADPHPWSIVLARSQQAEEILTRLAEAGRVELEDVSVEEIVHSQWTNIESKRYRQRKRMRVAALSGQLLPDWEDRLPKGHGSYWQEARTLLGKLRSARRHRHSTRATR